MIVGIGVDIVDISRIRAALERHKERFIHRVFTAEEQRFCQAHSDPVPHYAVRFAAKEALFKALGTGWAKGVTWLDAEVQRTDFGAPVMTLHGEAKKAGANLGARAVHVSLSHSDSDAIAFVVLDN
jgi:holo-[acyl-carrier protein] synthase